MIQLTSSQMIISIYNLTGTSLSTTVASSTIGNDNAWHTLSASLFNYYWYINVDGNNFQKIKDNLLTYNQSADAGQSYSIGILTNYNSGVYMSLTDIIIFGIPFNYLEYNRYSYSHKFNTQQYQGIIVSYYDFGQPL